MPLSFHGRHHPSYAKVVGAHSTHFLGMLSCLPLVLLAEASVTCARAHCQVPSAWLHTGMQIRGPCSKPPNAGLVGFSISTLVFLQNSKEISQRVHLGICKDFSLKLFELTDSTAGISVCFLTFSPCSLFSFF